MDPMRSTMQSSEPRRPMRAKTARKLARHPARTAAERRAAAASQTVVDAAGLEFGRGVRLAKRLLDFSLALAILCALSPLLAAIALAVKLSSRGPVLFCQDRVGRHGRVFRMLKFRTMRVDAEALSGPVWAQRNDPRCTRLGAVLRRLSCDELPQLWNVVRGEMSLVGPRPERPYFVERFSQGWPDYPLRHEVLPGLTGWAQVNGWRGNTSVRKRLECDLHYVRHWSLWLDLKILFLTPWRMWNDPHAY